MDEINRSNDTREAHPNLQATHHQTQGSTGFNTCVWLYFKRGYCSDNEATVGDYVVIIVVKLD